MKLTAASFIGLLIPLSGCSVVEKMTSGPAYDPYTLYLTNGMPVRVQNKHLDRYACAAYIPIVCECSGRAHKTCD